MPLWEPGRHAVRETGKIDQQPSPVRLSPLEKLFFMNPLRSFYSRVREAGQGTILERLLAEMRVTMRISAEDLARIPRTGACLAVSNHPFGILDGAVLGATLLRVRPDVKILTNQIIAAIEEMSDHCIYVDPFDRSASHRANIAGLRRAIAHVRSGGMLAVFPAGEVSHWQIGHFEVTDPEWSADVVRLVRLSGAAVLPAFFVGRNSNFFQTLGVVHPRLRTIQLPREFLNKAGKEVELRFGSVVAAEKVQRIAGDAEATQFLRWRTYLLGRREVCLPEEESPNLRLPAHSTASSSPDLLIAGEFEALPAEAVLAESREFKVFVARAERIPHALQEIGKQREIAFREAGEGTGKEIDLDHFDDHYQHLVLWSKRDSRIAGGYRFVNTAEALRQHGAAGLYTTSLFWIHPNFFVRTGPMLELGRSFIRREYRRQYSSLLLMWSAIGSYVARHPETPVLFGPVSISRAYSKTSREMLFRFFEAQRLNPFSEWIRPRRPFRSPPVAHWEWQAFRFLLDVDEISSSIAEIEADAKGAPVLLRQYLRLGGELLAFNVDKDFSDVLDGLILVDLRKTDPARLETYMGKSGLKRFLEHHAASEHSAFSAQTSI